MAAPETDDLQVDDHGDAVDGNDLTPTLGDTRKAGNADDRFLDPDHVKDLRMDKRIALLLTNSQALKSLLFNVVELGLSMFCYQLVGYFANWRYLEWSSENVVSSGDSGIEKPLWDVILTQIPELNESNALRPLADWFCYASVAVATFYCLFHLYVDLLNHLAFMISVLILCNMVVENVTVMPSSYGRARCLEFLGLTEENWRSYAFGISPSGTCAAMMWSGHTVHTLLAAYTFVTALERRYPAIKKFWKRSIRSMSGKTIVVYMWGLLQALLLLLNHGHYTSDIFVAMVIGTLTYSHDKLKYVATRHNIYLKDTPMAQIRARVQDSMELKDLQEFLALKAPDLLAKFKDPKQNKRLTVIDFVASSSQASFNM